MKAPDPDPDDLSSKTSTPPSTAMKAPTDSSGLFGAFRKGITQPMKMPSFAIPTLASVPTPAPPPPPPSSESVKRPPIDDSRRLKQALDEKEMAQNEITRLSAELAEQLAERHRNEAAIAKVATLEGELDKVRGDLARARDRVDYKRVQSNELETLKMKESNVALLNDVVRLTTELQTAQGQITALNLDRTMMQEKIERILRATSDAEAAANSAQQQTAEALAVAAALKEEVEMAVVEKEELKKKLAMSREAITIEARRDRERWQVKAGEKERQFFVELDAAVADRNALRAKAESLQTALDKVLKKMTTAAADEAAKWNQEKSRLEAELSRKASSLQDAMSALQTQDPTRRATTLLTLEVQRRLPQLSDADVKVIEQNYSFQSIAHSLIETVRDRDALIAQLRLDNTALSRKIGDVDKDGSNHKSQQQQLLP